MRIAYPFSIILEHGLTSPLKDQFSRTGYQYIFFCEGKNSKYFRLFKLYGFIVLNTNCFT